MMSQDVHARAENPAEQAKLLQNQATALPEPETSVSYDVWLGVDSGKFVLNWTVTPTIYGKYDWVGVFDSAEDAQNDPDGTYQIGGWLWADHSSPWTTYLKVASGSVAAYIVWNYNTGSYQAVAISEPYE